MVSRIGLVAFLVLTGCGGAEFTGELAPASEASDPGSGDGGGASSSSASSSPDSSSLADAPDSGLAAEGGDAASDAAPPACITDLSYVGVRDFYISFTLQTTAGAINMALLNQRTGCDGAGYWWDITYVTGTSGGGAVQFQMVAGLVTSGWNLQETGNSDLNDGLLHRIVFSRVAEQVELTVDGVLAGGPVPGSYDFTSETQALGPLAPLKVGTDDCPGFINTLGTIADVCITVP
jgi:hypothetical protein